VPAAADSGDAVEAAAATPAAEASPSPAPAAAAASGSSAPASPTATTPPMSPQRQLEARSADEMTTSVVRCLTFADTFLMSGKCHSVTDKSSVFVSTEDRELETDRNRFH